MTRAGWPRPAGDVGGPGARAPGLVWRAQSHGQADRRSASMLGHSGLSAALYAAALALGQAAPDAEPFVVFECVLKALGADIAGAAHLLGLSGGAALFRKERFRVRLGTQRTVLPGHPSSVVLADTKDVEPERDDLSHGTPPFPPGNPVPCAPSRAGRERTTQVKLHARVLHQVKRDP